MEGEDRKGTERTLASDQALEARWAAREARRWADLTPEQQDAERRARKRWFQERREERQRRGQRAGHGEG